MLGFVMLGLLCSVELRCVMLRFVRSVEFSWVLLCCVALRFVRSVTFG